ncbi:grn [Pungitius sinensis]
MFPMGVVILALLGLSSTRVCPDGGICRYQNTCCKNAVGGYGCCPLPYAQCCSDHLHCCYERTVCDLVHSRCVNKTVSLPMMRRVPQLQETLKAVICPDQESECPNDATCCQLLDGSWGCCPLPKAVCCEDKLHCCPEATKCDLAHSKCVSSSLESFPMLEKLPARRRHNHSVGSVSCPGGQSSCPDGSTCCLLPGGDYGCCPYSQAMCCSDHLHCCPSNTICDLVHGVCKDGEALFPLLKKIAAVPNDVKCPDETSVCPDRTTCCQMADGSYGCCPLPNAVCCSDHVHCCPEGTRCDVAHGTCLSTVTTLVEVQNKVSAVPCNDSVACADGNTCCKLAEGGWACCPLPQAVCCEDHLHCCPHATVCNLQAETCDDPSGVRPSVRWVEKASATRAVAMATPPARNMCDAQTSCPRDTTCCFMGRTRKWGCCPLPKAVCCQDGDHCCPSGHACEPHRSSCSKGPLVLVPWFSKLSARSEAAAAGGDAATDVKCDNKSSCASGTTCCKLKTGGWGCCPLVKAVCCADREHCCPQGYSCNMQTGTCEKKAADALLPPLPQVRLVRPGDHQDVACDVGGAFRCPRRDTCCRFSASEWGCCPSPGAVCCPDSKHCCPAGSSCDPKAGGCSPQPTWDRKRDVVPRGL